MIDTVVACIYFVRTKPLCRGLAENAVFTVNRSCFVDVIAHSFSPSHVEAELLHHSQCIPHGTFFD